jgi:nucleolar complex protein 3
LFAYFTHNDSRVAQIAILSALLVFKDIIPGYMIRSPGETDSKLVLKKETKRIMDYDQSLLQAYQRYLNILDNMISTGFGDLHKESSSSDHSDRWELGYNALKCQCELLRSVPHFNLRSKLITNIVNYACQPNSQISTLCCDCLIRIIGNDVQGDLSFDIVRSIAKNLIIHKHDVPERVLHVLEKVKIRIHEDVVKNIRKQAKKDRRKRKSDGDGVEASMLETEGINQTQVKIKQADCLREMTLIYFR